MHKALPVSHLASLSYDFTSRQLNTRLQEGEARFSNSEWDREKLDEIRASNRYYIKKFTPMSGMCSQISNFKLSIPLELVATFDI